MCPHPSAFQNHKYNAIFIRKYKWTRVPLTVTRLLEWPIYFRTEGPSHTTWLTLQPTNHWSTNVAPSTAAALTTYHKTSTSQAVDKGSNINLRYLKSGGFSFTSMKQKILQFWACTTMYTAHFTWNYNRNTQKSEIFKQIQLKERRRFFVLFQKEYKIVMETNSSLT